MDKMAAKDERTNNNIDIKGDTKSNDSDEKEQTKINRWIFGFGSLINTKSRELSYKTGDAYPVRVHNYKRIWNRFEGPKQPSMGMIKVNNFTVNGVIFRVNDDMLKAFDQRELKMGYLRKKILIKNIEILTNEIKLNDKLDIIETYELPILYKQEINNTSSLNECKNLRENHQVYIDVCLCGCMEYGEEFIKEFIKTTYDWRYKWKCNRCNVKTKRVWNYTKCQCQYFDKLLKQYIMEYHSIIPEHLNNGNESIHHDHSKN